jgi:hypothetical protein
LGCFFGTAAGAVFTSPSSGTAAGALNAQHPRGTAPICSILLVFLPYVPGHIGRPTGRITPTAERRWGLDTKHCMTVTGICQLLNSDRCLISNGNTASDVCQKAPGPITVIQLAIRHYWRDPPARATAATIMGQPAHWPPATAPHLSAFTSDAAGTLIRHLQRYHGWQQHGEEATVLQPLVNARKQTDNYRSSCIRRLANRPLWWVGFSNLVVLIVPEAPAQLQPLLGKIAPGLQDTPPPPQQQTSTTNTTGRRATADLNWKSSKQCHSHLTIHQTVGFSYPTCLLHKGCWAAIPSYWTTGPQPTRSHALFGICPYPSW